jgi:hypothetical protein
VPSVLSSYVQNLDTLHVPTNKNPKQAGQIDLAFHPALGVDQAFQTQTTQSSTERAIVSIHLLWPVIPPL